MDKTTQSKSTLEIIEANARDTGTYMGALLILLPVVPIIATLISIVTFIGQKIQEPAGASSSSWVEASIPLLVGTLSAFLLWLLLASSCRRFTAVDRVHADSYHGLLNHLSSLDASIDSLLPEDVKKETLDMLRNAMLRKSGNAPNLVSQPPQPRGSARALDPIQEVLYCRNAICLALMQRSTSWALGDGYSKLWDWMDKAEEAVIISAPLEKVVGDAVLDEMRLNDSKMDNSEEWANKLRSAVKILNADAVRYLKPSMGTYPLTEGTEKASPASSMTGSQAPALIQRLCEKPAGVGSHLWWNLLSALFFRRASRPLHTALQIAAPNQATSPNQTTEAKALQQAQARAVLRKIRETINDFNTKSWDGLVKVRNQLLATMILVGLATYVFVEFAILLQVKTSHIEVAMIIAFVGALSGLIGRLSLESQTGMAIDDYHLSTARLLVTPLLSALAAVIGVLIVAKASRLDDIYAFNALVPNLIIAATFGLTPNVLINQLQKKADEYKGNLLSTKATSGK